ncbi:MAG: response regulator [Planctomycetota bacterium]
MSAPAPAPERRILVIEDEESMRHALGKALGRAGWRVETAPTGREGVERLRTTRYDVVLSDVRLPDLSGLDVVALVTETSPGTPVVVMTAFGTVETALVAMKRGARDFVTKPFEMPALLKILEHAVAAPAATGDARLRIEVERRFAPEEYARVESELRRAPGGEPSADEPAPAAEPGEAGMPKAGDDPLELRDAQRRFEIRYVEDLLARTGGNVAAAARLAGISRPNLHKKLKVLGVDPAKFKRAHRRGRAAGL